MSRIFKLVVSTTIIVLLLLIIEESIYRNFIFSNTNLSEYLKILIRFALLDIFIIYFASAFAEFEVIATKAEEARLDKEAEEKAKIYSDLATSSGKKK